MINVGEFEYDKETLYKFWMTLVEILYILISSSNLPAPPSSNNHKGARDEYQANLRAPYKTNRN